MSLLDFYRSGRNVKALYYAAAAMRMAVPRAVLQKRRRRLLATWQDREDADMIARRVDFYCRREAFAGGAASLPDAACRPDEIGLHDWPSTYYFDAMRWLRYFPRECRVALIGGDVWENPPYPALMKARRLDERTANGVLLNMDRVRHFLHPHDHIPFDMKAPRLIFRGDCYRKPVRLKMLADWSGSPLLDLGDTNGAHPSEWSRARMSIPEQFAYQFVLAPEGNDVASAVQWIMASECVPVLPEPSVESWLMHSAMRPGEDYIGVKRDFSDLGDKIEYYASHQAEARAISENSRRWAAQFADPRREEIISLLVIERYLRLTGQL